MAWRKWYSFTPGICTKGAGCKTKVGRPASAGFAFDRGPAAATATHKPTAARIRTKLGKTDLGSRRITFLPLVRQHWGKRMGRQGDSKGNRKPEGSGQEFRPARNF